MKINEDLLHQYLIFNREYRYSDSITLYPIKMIDIVLFQMVSPSITVRKNSIFRDKKIIKMTYLDFLLYCIGNTELEKKYEIKGLSNYYLYAVQLLKMSCKNSDVTVDDSGKIHINSELVTPQIFDDLRQIIIIQNGIDFDINDFLNRDTEKSLMNAKKITDKQQNETANIEDYIDSVIIAMKTNEETVMNMTIRKFWRYVKRYQMYEKYNIMKTGECSGMVKFKDPIKYWMVSIDKDDKYKEFKTNEDELRSKIS